MTPSQACYALVKQLEGFRSLAYRDGFKGVWTIGFGHTRNVVAGMACSEFDAVTWLTQTDGPEAAAAVNDEIGNAITTQAQFDAMVAFTFNEGSGHFATSSILARHRDGLYAEAADAFLLWDKAHIDGQLVTVPGLLTRRETERAMYLSNGATA